MSSYDRLIELTSHYYVLNNAFDLLYWEREQSMPEGQAELRGMELAAISSARHFFITHPEIPSLLSELSIAELTEDQRVNVREIASDYTVRARVPSSLMARIAKNSDDSFTAWKEAKQKSDFSLWWPHLERTVELQRERARMIDPHKDPYETLLNFYEPDVTLAQMESYLSTIKERVVPLVRRIQNSTVHIDDSWTRAPVDEQAQWAFNHNVAAMLGYDFNKGRLDKSAHPMTLAGGRITNRIEKDNFLNMISSDIHEVGHAKYDHNRPFEHFGTPLGEQCSLGEHEGNSRLWENHIGRSMEFCTFLAPHLNAAYGTSCTPQALYEAFNMLRVGPERLKADELTYPLHIALRFEIERDLIYGTLQVKDIPAVWNKKTQELLGVMPENDAQGCLQDSHWCDDFGYFPVYEIGSMSAAQKMASIRRDIPDVMARVQQGDFTPIDNWLRERIWIHGRRYPTKELIRRATGKELGAEDYLAHLEKKFSALYNL